MTTIDTTVDDVDVPAEQTLCWLSLDELVPHPDNPRKVLGDLTELTRSIRSHGVLQPLVCALPDENGIHGVVAGCRRLAAARKAGLTTVAAVVRPFSTAEVIDSGLSENGNRTDLTLSEEVGAIERRMSLEAGLTPAKLCKRIGRSQAWIRSRMAVTILPPRWRAALDKGDLTLAAGEAAASAADLGPEHLDTVCERITRSRWQEPIRVVEEYRTGLVREETYAKAVEKAVGKYEVVFTDEEAAPTKSKRLGELFDTDGCKAHAGEPCHAVVVQRRSWGTGAEEYAVCTDPRRHAPSRVGTANGSDLATDRGPRNSSGGGDSHDKRKGRLSRLAHATEVMARSRGGISQADLTRFALRALVWESGMEARKYAATILGLDKAPARGEDFLALAETPAGMVRLAGAIALGLAESNAYWSLGSGRCQDYVALLTGSGWEPDDWTAAALARAEATRAEDEVEVEVEDDPADDDSADDEEDDDEEDDDEEDDDEEADDEEDDDEEDDDTAAAA